MTNPVDWNKSQNEVKLDKNSIEIVHRKHVLFIIISSQLFNQLKNFRNDIVSKRLKYENESVFKGILRLLNNQHEN